MPARHLTAILLLILATGCEGGRSEGDVVVAGGNAGQGAVLISLLECGACHTIPGIDEAEGTVGPPLTNWSRRSYIAGNIPNTPDNLVTWLLNPHAVEPGTAMPDIQMSEQQARDIAAYLYTLE